jgi:ribosomal protein S27E
MRVKCISCGHELNLDHFIFEDYSGPVKCFSCSAMISSYEVCLSQVS